MSEKFKDAKFGQCLYLQVTLYHEQNRCGLYIIFNHIIKGPFQTAYFSCGVLFMWRTFHVPVFIVELSTAEERRRKSVEYNRIRSGKSSTQVKQRLSH